MTPLTVAHEQRMKSTPQIGWRPLLLPTLSGMKRAVDPTRTIATVLIATPVHMYLVITSLKKKYFAMTVKMSMVARSSWKTDTVT